MLHSPFYRLKQRQSPGSKPILLSSNMKPHALSPFDLDNDHAYQIWRDEKLAHIPIDISALIVEVKDLNSLSKTEKDKLSASIKVCNMAIYASEQGQDGNKRMMRQFGRQFGLEQLDHNMGVDDGITELEVKTDPLHGRYIPYSNRAIRWHTDGYYNTPEQTIRGLLLHCVEPAATGGETALLDHELAYIHLRDLNPAYIRALMQPDVITIPANIVDGKTLRPGRSAPVFSIDMRGNLHMNYTERARNIEWKDQPRVSEAIKALVELMHSDAHYIYRGTLHPGQGLICNNVLHDRSAFENSARQARLLYRMRYYDRITL